MMRQPGSQNSPGGHGMSARTDTPLLALARGALAGGAATVAMSVPMVMARRLGLIDRQPPEQITDRVLHKIGTPVGGTELDMAALVAHEAFGAVAGAGYTLLRRRVSVRVPDEVLGVGYGVAIWLVSYRGLLPRLRLITTGRQVGRRRDTLMLVAHVVYGWVLGRLA